MSRFNYEDYAWQPPEEDKAFDYFAAATPARAELYAAEYESKRPTGPLSKPAASLLSNARDAATKKRRFGR